MPLVHLRARDSVLCKFRVLKVFYAALLIALLVMSIVALTSKWPERNDFTKYFYMLVIDKTHGMNEFNAIEKIALIGIHASLWISGILLLSLLNDKLATRFLRIH